MPRSTNYVWFLQALNVMNAALDLHRDSLRLRPMLSDADAKLDGCNLVVAIVDDLRPSRKVDYVTIRLQQGHFVLVSHARTTPRTDWRVSKSYLVDVAKNPRQYFDDPGQLDFTWLQKRVGLEQPGDAAVNPQVSAGVFEG